MGAVCCCLNPQDFEEYTAFRNGSMDQNCVCLRRCVCGFLRMYSTWFDDVDDRDVLSPSQYRVSTSPTAGLLSGNNNNNVDTSLPESFQAPPPRHPLPYDAEAWYLGAVGDGLVSRQEKSGMSHMHAGEMEPLQQMNLFHGAAKGGESLAPVQQRRNGGGSEHRELGQGFKLDSFEKHLLSSKGFARVESTLSLADDEDMCPTCLDGYTEENPKISTACGHHFHLACIYGWMEYSKHCPMCDKEMIFNESL
ncbi:hypothetical protein CY35_07G090200 [Sphagnum magellanicum]|uniref:Uncharacterized protein n=1 Tax=Sphagnum magellanicum TaxID=128215 RepID=A0ACB8HMW1_9BRYO|nr:hypothetical protein CY35_07G090200 [Sphagnum magellanicum]